MKRASIQLQLASLLCLGALATRAAADSEPERRTLAGLQGVHVFVAAADPAMVRAGLPDSVLRLDLETKLRAAGIRILSREEAPRIPGVPWLYLTASVVQSANERVYAWSTRLVLRQRVCLERDPKSCDTATTWETSRFGTVGTRKLAGIREDIGLLADDFVTAWQAANPK